MAVLCLLPILIFGDWDYKTHDANNIKCWVSNFGVICQDPAGGCGLEWPQGSGQYYIFGAGTWFGSILAGGDTCVTVGYNPNSGSGEFVPGLIRQDTSAYTNPYVRVYLYPEDWPADPDSFPMAPQGHRTDEDSWACFNDNDSTYHVPMDTHPLGIEVYQTGYADTDCPDAIFFKYTIKNCTTYTIPDARLGICVDYDIGSAGDDAYGLIYQQWFPQGADSFFIDALPYGYDSDWQEAGWDSVGVVGIYMIHTPEDVGPTASMCFTLELDPPTDPDRYLTMKGINYVTGDSVGFMPGISGPDDRRTLFSTGPFTLDPGETDSLGFVIVLAYDTISIAYKAHDAKLWWEENIGIAEETSSGIDQSPIATITNGNLIIGKVDRLRIIDPTGRLVKKYQSPPEKIKLDFLSAGIYFAIIEEGDKLRQEKILIIR